MPNFGDSSESEKAGPDNGIYQPVEIQIAIKYNTEVLNMQSDVDGMVIEALGSNSGGGPKSMISVLSSFN